MLSSRWSEDNLVPSPEPVREPDAVTPDVIKIINDRKTNYSPLAFPVDIGKLHDTALVALTALLIRHRNTLQAQCQNDEVFVVPEVELITARFPATLGSKINSIAKKMKSSISEWQKYHHKYVFFDRDNGEDCILIYDWFDDLSWSSDGSINGKLTAIKMLNSFKLTDVERIRLACWYCIEKEVKSSWKKLPGKVIDKELKTRNPFVLYWHSVRRKDNTGVRNVLNVMINSTHNFHYAAFEYVWSKMKPNCRLHYAKEICKFSNCSYIWHMLCDLNDSEFDSVIEEKCLHIFVKFAKNVFRKHILKIWDRIADRVGVDSFHNIFKRIVVSYLNLDSRLQNRLSWELWRRAPEKLKNTAASASDDYLLRPYNFPLIADILSRVRFEDRVKYWHRNWHQLLTEPSCQISTFQKIMGLCFVNKDAISTFKNTQMIDYDVIGKSCRSLLENGPYEEDIKPSETESWDEPVVSRFKQLQRYLNTCSSDPTVISNLKTRILTETSTEKLLRYILNSKDPLMVDEFNEFLADAFTPETLRKYKTAFISSPGNSDIIDEQMFNNLDQFPVIMKLIDVFSACEEDAAKIKGNLLSFLHVCISEGNLVSNDRYSNTELNSKKIKWKDFMNWCFDGDQNQLKEFKESLLLDNIFKSALKNLFRTISWYDMLKCEDPRTLSHARRDRMYGCWMKNFTALNSFLDWFLESEELVRKFKLNTAAACDSDYLRDIFTLEFERRGELFDRLQMIVPYKLALWSKI